MPGPGLELGATGGDWGGLVAEEEFPKTISFLSKVRIPAWGGGGRDPSLREPSGPARPSEGRGGGREAARAPGVGRRRRAKGPAGLQGRGIESGITRPRERATGQGGAGPELLRAPDGLGAFRGV